MDFESLKDYVIVDMIEEVKQMTRDELERRVIDFESRKIESLKDLSEIKEYGKQKSKA